MDPSSGDGELQYYSTMFVYCSSSTRSSNLVELLHLMEKEFLVHTRVGVVQGGCAQMLCAGVVRWGCAPRRVVRALVRALVHALLLVLPRALL